MGFFAMEAIGFRPRYACFRVISPINRGNSAIGLAEVEILIVRQA